MSPPTVIKLHEGDRLCLRHICVFNAKHNYIEFTAMSSKALLEGGKRGGGGGGRASVS